VSQFKPLEVIMATGVGEILRRLRQSHVKDEETTPGEAQKGRPQGARR